MARPLSLTPEDGPYITLADLRDFVAECYSRNFPERQQVRIMGAVEINMAHGPRATRLTAVPGEVSDE
jgi:hypothetical protein